MKKYITTLMLGMMFLSLEAGAVSMIVQDVGAYTRMAQQIETAQKMLQEAKSQVSELESLRKSMTGNKKQALGFENHINSTRHSIANLTNHMMNMTIPDEYQSKDSMGHLMKMLDQIYVPASEMKGGDVSKSLRESYHQLALKSSLASSEALLRGQELSLNHLGQLSGRINQTQNMKDAQDLTNQLLAEIVLSQQQMVTLLAEMTRAQAASKYVGSKHAASAASKKDDRPRHQKVYDAWTNNEYAENPTVKAKTKRSKYRDY